MNATNKSKTSIDIFKIDRIDCLLYFSETKISRGKIHKKNFKMKTLRANKGHFYLS